MNPSKLYVHTHRVASRFLRTKLTDSAMSRLPQTPKLKGSQRWLQVAVNYCPTVIDRAICDTGIPLREPIVWTSPLASDDFAEYMDAAFLNQIGVRLDQRRLRDFWPNSGPPVGCSCT